MTIQNAIKQIICSIINQVLTNCLSDKYQKFHVALTYESEMPNAVDITIWEIVKFQQLPFLTVQRLK